MQLFKSILESENPIPQPDDKRKLRRHPVGADFPFRTKLTLFQNGGSSSGTKGKDWSATVVNLSEKGASIQVSLAAVAFPKEACRLKFSLKEYHFELPATIAHFRCCSQYSLCGILFNFPDAEAQRDYYQLLQPVIIGGSLVPVETEQDTPDRYKEQFGGATSNNLNIWRSEAGGDITSFDLRMLNYAVIWNEGAAELEVYGVTGPNPDEPESRNFAFIELTEEQHEQVRWLFCLAVPNLPKSVPQDIRKFLATLVA